MSVCISCSAKILTLGPEGTNGHQAALAARNIVGVGDDCPIEFCKNHHSILTQMHENKDCVGIVAVENSTNGYVREVLEYWLPCILNGGAQPLFQVIGEVEVKVEHYLLARHGMSIENLDGVLSHPQAFGQCSHFLNNHNWVKTPCNSTSAAADLVAHDAAYARYGAIASKLAAASYNLHILQKAINDSCMYGDNITRFYILGHNMPIETGNDWTALLVQVPDELGAMNKITNVISANNINMSVIHSIPFGALRKYAFYVEMEGHQNDRAVRAALSSIGNITNDKFVILGSFPKAQTNEEL